MKKIGLNKNLIYVLGIILITALTILIVSSVPGYLREQQEDSVGLQLRFIIVFLIIDIILIGIPAGIHGIYVKDYSKLRNIWFFAVFGGITGALMGEKSFVMIIPYTILMLIYAFLYRKFPWWKVVLTSYLAGVLIENVMNRSPIQSPTLLWISFFYLSLFCNQNI